jgi:hypothetical protein
MVPAVEAHDQFLQSHLPINSDLATAITEHATRMVQSSAAGQENHVPAGQPYLPSYVSVTTTLLLRRAAAVGCM